MIKRMVLPEVAALELTYTCNHRCFFCSCPWENDSAYKSKELSLDEWISVIDLLLSRGVKTITLTGGEPLTRADLDDILSYISKSAASLVLISNGRAIDEAFIERLATYHASLCISVPGIESYETHTGVDNIDHVLSQLFFEPASNRITL